MLLLASLSFAYDSDPADVRLQDEADLFTNMEFSTGYLPSGSPLAVEFRIEANGGAAVEMEGQADLSWPEAVTLAFTGEPGSGIYLLDASLDAVTTVQVDLSDFGYTGLFELDRRTLYMDGATFFDPFVLDGSVEDRVEVTDTLLNAELINYSYEIFAGVELNFTAEMEPVITAGFEGVSFTANEGSILAAGAPAVLDYTPEPDFIAATTFRAQWDAGLDLIFTPTISACFPIYGCVEIVSFDIPVEVLTDAFEQDFPPVPYTFPMPILQAGITSGDLGTVEPGQLATLQVPIGNLGNLAVYGDVTIEGDGEFTVFPSTFNANPGTEDGLVVTFAPTYEGAQTANLVLNSNDPAFPVVAIPLTGNGVIPEDPEGEDNVGDEQVVTESVDGCGCASADPSAPMAGLLAVAFLARRRRKQA